MNSMTRLASLVAKVSDDSFVPVSQSSVLVTTRGLNAMANVWPCSGLPRAGYCVIFGYDSNKNLCDISWFDENGLDMEEPNGIDQSCLAALSQDAEAFLTDGQ